MKNKPLETFQTFYNMNPEKRIENTLLVDYLAANRCIKTASDTPPVKDYYYLSKTRKHTEGTYGITTPLHQWFPSSLQISSMCRALTSLYAWKWTQNDELNYRTLAFFVCSTRRRIYINPTATNRKNSMILHGENLIIMADGVALAASKSCTINVKANTLDVSSDNDGDWEHHIPGRKSWDVSTSHLFVTEENAAVLKNSIRKVGVSFTLQFTVIGDTSDTMTGTCHLHTV